jgi:drug/metabolite transporter (DMT)-like permease
MNAARNERWLIIGAFAAVYIVWGSTYLANYWAIQSIPPFLMSATRFLSAGALLYAAAAMSGVPAPNWKQWRVAALMGFLMLSVGTGGVVWAVQYVDTGIVALIVAFQPLLVILLMWIMRRKRPGAMVLGGVALGIAGMALLVSQKKLTADERSVMGICVVFVSMLSWGYATVTTRRGLMPSSGMRSSAMQMIGGAAGLLVMSAIVGEWRHFELARIGPRSALAWVYLVLMGSILTFSAYNYLLRRVSPDKVSTSNYVNPVVALLLGWGLNGEVVSARSLLAAAIMLLGVFFINTRLKPKWTPSFTPRLNARKTNAPRPRERMPKATG